MYLCFCFRRWRSSRQYITKGDSLVHKVQSGGVTNESVIKVEVEFCKSSEVAEFGEHAPSTKRFDISFQHEISEKENLLQFLKEHAEKENFDTFVIQKELFVEEVFYLVEK